MRSSGLALGLTLALALPALAQAPQGTPTRVRGTIEKLDGNTLLVKSRDGTDVSVDLAPNVGVSTLQRKSLSDIKQGDFVASTGRKGPDGKLHAVEVRIFPEALRGRGEGQFPWDLEPGDMMTNATVTGIASAAQGETLTVKYKDTQSDYIVDPGTPVLAQVPGGDKSLLKPNVYVVVLAFKQPDGKLTAANITAEANGVKPPM